MNMTDLCKNMIREWEQPSKCETLSNIAIVLIIDGSPESLPSGKSLSPPIQRCLVRF